MVRKVNQWAPIAGDWSFQAYSAKYTGTGDSADGIVLSPVRLRSGRISVKVRLRDTERSVGRILLGYDAETERHYSVGLGGYESAYSVESEVVIAEISSSNASVFYELGYAHALDKPTVLLARRGEVLPFDVSGYRVIFYDDTIGGKSEVEATLDQHLANIKP